MIFVLVLVTVSATMIVSHGWSGTASFHSAAFFLMGPDWGVFGCAMMRSSMTTVLMMGPRLSLRGLASDRG
jgi:hypothetical protein